MARFAAHSFILSSALVAASFASALAAPMQLRDRVVRLDAAATPSTKAVAPAGVGSSNTITADPPVPRPDEAPCVSKLFTASTFAAYAPQTFSYRPPAGCPGPFSEIVFNGDFRVSAGIQFDRTGSVEIGNVPLFFGTTAEPSPNLSPSWHVERDVTDDAKLLARPQPGEVDIFNIVDSTYTGVITGTAYLQFYPATRRAAAATPPDLVLPVPNATGGPQHLPTGQSILSATYAFPRNVERAYLDVYAQSQQTDEQYFLCAPSNVAAELFSCPNTAFRETEISIDGRPAGAAPVYPWIFTGGLDPYLWFPIPGVQTLNFKPYRVDLTPFAAILANGASHTIAFSVDNADNYFQGFATLYVYEDRASRRVSGAVTRDTLHSGPVPVVHTDLSGTSPAVDGTIRVTNARDYAIDGYVQTSHGRVTTSLNATLDFTNYQRYSNESETTGDLSATQTTTATTTVLTRSAQGTAYHEDTVSFPVSVSLATVLDATVTGSQKAKVEQHFSHAEADLDASGFRASLESNEVSSADTLLIADGGISGNSGQHSAQTYVAADTAGYCYAKSLAAENNVLVSDGRTTCDAKAAARALRALRF
jgi:hypothetical protein